MPIFENKISKESEKKIEQKMLAKLIKTPANLHTQRSKLS
jgi:hypothetical protein